MKKYSFSSLVSLLLFIGSISWGFSPPIDKVATLYTGERDIHINVATLLTKGSYMAVLYKLTKDDPDFYKIVVCIVNLDNGKKTYEVSFSKGKDTKHLPWAGHLSIKDGYLSYISKKGDEHFITIHRVELATGAETTRPFSCTVILKSDDSKIMIFNSSSKKLFVYRAQNGDVETYDLLDKELPSHRFVTETKCIVYDGGSYLLKDIVTGETITLGTGNITFLPGAPIFSLLTQTQTGNWILKLYKRDGTQIKDISLLELFNNDRFISFKEVDTSSKASLFMIKAGINPSKTYYLLIDASGNIIKKISGQDIENIKIVDEDHLIVFRRIVTNNNPYWTVAYDNTSFVLPSIANLSPYNAHYINLGTGERLLIDFDGSNGLKYSLSDGQIKGLYLFPAEYITKFVKVHKNRIYILSLNRGEHEDDKKASLGLYSFSASTPGWIPVDVSFSPTFDEPDVLYENTNIRVDIRGNCNYGLDELTVDVDKGSLSRSNHAYIWHTPNTKAFGETAHLIFKLGPIISRYPVTIKKSQNVLSIHLEKDKRNRDPWIFNINGIIDNNLDKDIDGLTWTVKTKGIRPALKGRTWTDTLPKIIGRKGSTFSIYGDILARDVDVKWNGYKIVRSFTVSFDSRWGHVESSISDNLTIESRYYFTIEFKDQDTGKIPLEIDKDDLDRLKIFTEDGENITDKLQISFKGPHWRTDKVSKKDQRVGNGIIVSGISPGLSEKPLNLTLKYGPFTKKVSLFFDARYGYRYSPPTIVMGVDEEAGLKFVIKDDDGNEINNANIIVKRVGADFSYLDYSALSPGRYDIFIWKEGYIPYHCEIALERRKKKTLEVTLKKFVGIVFNLESYYKGPLKDVKKCEIKDVLNLTRITDHIYIMPEGHDTLYFGVTYKVGYPDIKVAKVFAEDEYSVSCWIRKAKEENYIYLDNVYQGEPIKTFKKDELFRSPDSIKSVKIENPTLILVELKAKAKHTKEERFGIWFFPSSWNNYKTEALQGVLLYSLRGVDLDRFFSFGDEAEKYLKRKSSQLSTSAFDGILWYGISSLDFLKGAMGIPDFGLIDIGNTAIQYYVDYTLNKEIVRIKIEEKDLDKLDGLMTDSLLTGVSGEVFSALSTIISAGEWARGLSYVVKEGEAGVVAGAILEALTGTKNFQFIKDTVNSFIEPVNNIIVAVDENKPQSIRETMKNLCPCVVKGCGEGKSALCDIFAMEFTNIIEWESGNSWPPCLPENYISYPNDIKCLASEKAMKYYKPVIRLLFDIAAPVIDACIMKVE